MRVIIAGGRDVTNPALLLKAIEEAQFDITSVVCGKARGADTLGEEWARANDIPIAEYPANWASGRSAGYERNALMARNADAVIALWDGESKGTGHMIKLAKMLRLKLFVFKV